MNREETEEVFDFKPFFDMIVGVLFVLLILVASQMFFVRHDLSSQAEASAAVAAERREQELARQRLEGEITVFLDRVAAALTRGGLRSEVSRGDGRILVALPTHEESDRTEQELQKQGGAIAAALSGPVACATDSGHGKGNCPVYRHLRVQAATLRLDVQAKSPAQQADGEAARTAVLLAAHILRSEPTLFDLKTRDGTFVLPPQLVTGHKGLAAVTDGTQPKDQSRQLTIGFTFTQD